MNKYRNRKLSAGITCLENTSIVSESCCSDPLHHLPIPWCSREMVTMVTTGTTAKWPSTWQQRPRSVTSHRESTDWSATCLIIQLINNWWIHVTSDLCRWCLKLWRMEGWWTTSLWMTSHWLLMPVAPPPLNLPMYRLQQPCPLYQVSHRPRPLCEARLRPHPYTRQHTNHTPYSRYQIYHAPYAR